ncbi:MAG TPA: hypothetical protein VFX76_00570, partial [Roseiflexaceae bacterium]|nr:hypothetical protein [Roseiflexaceae bacterium]
MSHARGATDGPMGRSAAPPTSFLDRLLAHISPQHPPPDRGLLEAQLACGRWCALRRLRLELSSERFADIVGISVEQLRWLEAGLDKPEEVPADARQRLSRFLRARDEERAWVADAVALA